MPWQLQEKTFCFIGDQDEGQGVEPPVRAYGELVTVMGGIKVW